MNRPGASEAPDRFANNGARIAAACFGGLVVLLGLAGLTQGAWTAVAFLIVGGAFLYRGLRSATVVLTDSEVELRGFARTRRLRVADLSVVDVAVGRTGMNGFGREYLILKQRDGTTSAFKELNAKPSSARLTVVQEAARALNAAIAGHRRPSP
jgi:hypothetical protein